MGSAWAAYAYNQGRFQFDAGQKQTFAHQLINMRIQQWSLFREDIRDLFNLTTSHMSTYMVVGTLFLGYSVSHMWYITTFPEDPPWLKFFWMNCFISAMCYGFLAVWLAMHGAIAAQSASVQLLTRAIRPPYPSVSELGNVRHELANYEASGPLKFFSPPKFAGRGSGMAPMAPNSSALPERSQSSVQASATEGPEDQQGHAFDGPSSKHPAGLPSPWEFAPGLSAEMGMHVKLFQQLQETFLPFDAYARVCLMTGVSNVVTAFSYFWIAHQDWSHEGSFLAALGGSCLLMFTTLVLYKLDLYVEKRRLWIFKSVVLCAPIVSMASLITWRKGQGWQAVHALTELVLVCSTCLMHICWLVLFVWEARPSKENLDLPLSFRSVRYLDVFSSLRKRQALQRQMARSASRRRRASVSENSEEMGAVEHLSADYIFHVVQELLKACEHSQSLLSEEEVRCLQLAKARLLEQGMSDEDTAPRHEEHEGLWLQRILENDLGQPVLYFVNLKTLDVTWTDPPISQQLFFDDLDVEIRRLLDPAGESLAGDVILGQETSDDLQRFEIADSEGAEAPSGPSVPAAQQPLVPTLRRPGSSHGQSSMPWKYFLQISSMILCVWVVTTLYCMINVGREAGRAKLLQGGPWPHDFFAPSALACHEQQVLLGDRFAVYPGRIDQEGLSVDDAIFSTLEGHGFEWGAIAASAQHLFLLQRDGHAIHEFFHGAVQRWEVSLADAVHAMSLLSADLARQHCAQKSASEADSHPWAILAAAGHDVVILCPRRGHGSHGSHGTLYPRRWLPQAASQHATVAVQMPSREHLWLLRSQTLANPAEKSAKVWLVREHLQSGQMDNFALPKDRSWAPGLCIRNSSVLLAAYHPRDKSPEIWHLEMFD